MWLRLLAPMDHALMTLRGHESIRQEAEWFWEVQKWMKGETQFLIFFMSFLSNHGWSINLFVGSAITSTHFSQVCAQMAWRGIWFWTASLAGKIGGHLYIGNFSAVLWRSFTAAVSAVITRTYLSAQFTFTLYILVILVPHILSPTQCWDILMATERTSVGLRWVDGHHSYVLLYNKHESIYKWAYLCKFCTAIQSALRQDSGPKRWVNLRDWLWLEDVTFKVARKASECSNTI